MGERVLPPCAAYFEMAEILGPTYFLTPLPLRGVEVTVMGRDGQASVWCMSESMAGAVQPHVRSNRGLRWVAQRPYTSLEPKA